MKIQDRIKYGVGVFKGLGVSQQQAIGALGSMMGESGRKLKTDAYNPNDPGDGAFGIAQWHSDRRRALERFAKRKGTDVKDFKTQMDFVAHELKTTHKGALEKLKAAKTMDQAARSWTLNYERPAAKYRHHNRRLENAKYAAGVLGGVDVDGITTNAVNSAVDSDLTADDGDFENVDDKLNALSPKKTNTGPFGGVMDLFSDQANNTFNELNELGKLGSNLLKGNDVMASAGGLIGKIPGADDPNNPLGAISNFLTEATPGMKIGSIAGGIIGGPTGTLVGGLLGQGLNMMLRDMAQQQQKLNEYPDAPEGGTRGSGGLTKYGEKVKSESGQFSSAVSSGQGGLW